ncbi:MAG: hypothetical protein QXS51_05160 [Thermoproteota archaeon]
MGQYLAPEIIRGIYTYTWIRIGTIRQACPVISWGLTPGSTSTFLATTPALMHGFTTGGTAQPDLGLAKT